MINIATSPTIITTANTATAMMMAPATADSVAMPQVADSVMMPQVVVVVLHRVVVPPVVVGAAVVATVECGDTRMVLQNKLRFELSNMSLFPDNLDHEPQSL